MKFEKGQPVTELLKLESTDETGTTIQFIPDKEIMGDYEILIDEIEEILQKLSYLSKGLNIQYHVKRTDGKNTNKVFKSENGHLDYIKDIEKNPMLKKPIYIEDKAENKQLYVAINYSTKRDDDLILSFVNNMATTEHGTHVQGLKMALTTVFKKYITDNNLLQKKDAKLEINGDDVIGSISVIIELKWIEPLFDSQTKDRLTSTDVTGYVRTIVSEQLMYYLNKNKNEAKNICNKIILNAKGRKAAKAAKILTKKKETGFTSLSNLSKFTKASDKNPENLELFIVEGNSAGGSAAQGRNTETQAIYRLRGKPLNCCDLDTIKILANKEFNDIVNILGTGIDKNFDISRLTHDTIVVMSDADVDGFHISSLLLTFFYKHMRPLIDEGHIYCAMPPLYKIRENNKDLYIIDKEDYNSYIANKIISDYTIGAESGGKIKQLPDKMVKSLLKLTSNYVFKLDNVSAKLAAEPELIEIIIKNKEKDLNDLATLISNKYEFIETQMVDKGLFVDGLIDGNYQSLIINDQFFLEVKEISNILENIPFSNFVVKAPSDSKARRITLYSLLKEVFDYATPAKMTRYKGLGEMNPQELYETSMNPLKRNLIKVTVKDVEVAEKRVNDLMGKNAEPRKLFLKEYEINTEDLDG